MNNLSGQRIKTYDLLEQIGAGGFGAVYRAYHPAVDRTVAIKVILPQYASHAEFIRRFEAEARVVARLEHPFIVPLYDYWRDPDGAYLVMRFLPGSLRERLRRGPLSLDETRRMVEQLASALAVAHRNNVVHRDLKPANILLDDDHNAYLADFGIAKSLLAAGRLTQEDRVIGSPAYLSPEQIKTDPITPSADIYAFGIMLYEMLSGHHPFPDDLTPTQLLYKQMHDPLPSLRLDRPDIPGPVDGVIQKATAKKPEDRYPDILSVSQAFHTTIGQAPTQIDFPQTTTMRAGIVPYSPDEATWTPSTPGFTVRNPYKGLRPFEEADAADFFGRDALVSRLLARIEEPARFLAVIGPSGSGKSSVVKAGIMSALRAGRLPGSENWFVIDMTPGSDPLGELVTGLTSVAARPAAHLADQLRADPRGLLWASESVLASTDGDLLLVIDQFEELFTPGVPEGDRAHFLDLLHAAATGADSRIRVIVTLRADFTDRPLQYVTFGDLMRQHTEFVLPLTSAELERAITGPAERAGVTVDAELLATIIADVRDEPGALPLLQYALTEIFEQREGNTLALTDYQRIGGVSGALARRAGSVFADLDVDQQALAQQIFLRLVTLGEGVEDTRRRAGRSELAALVENAGLLESVLDAFGRPRLLTFDHDSATREPTVEIAHEALIREWQQLRLWLDTTRTGVRQQRMLAAAAAEWENARRDRSFLLTGSRLIQFEDWAETTTVALTRPERDFLEASTAERARITALEQARRARETALERRSRRILGTLAGVMAVAAVLALVLTVIALGQRQDAQHSAATATVAQGQALIGADQAATAAAVAERSAAEANSLALAASSQLALADDNTDLAIVLALEANRISDPPLEAQRALAGAAYAPGTIRQFVGHSDAVMGVAFSPDGTQALSASLDHTLILWDVATGEIVRRFEGHSDWVRDVAFSPDGRRALSASSDHTIILWDVDQGTPIRTLEGHADAVLCVAFSPNGTQALSGAADYSVILWDVESGELLKRLEGHTDRVFGVAFGPAGLTALTASADESMIMWNLKSGLPVMRLLGHTNGLSSVIYSPDALMALSAGGDNVMILWSFETGEPVRRFEGHTARVTSASFSPDGRLILSASEDNTLILWDAQTAAALHRFKGHTDKVFDVAFSPEGRTAISCSGDGTLRLWDVENGAEIRRFSGHTAEVYALALSPDGYTLVSGGEDKNAVVWDTVSGEALYHLEGHTDAINVAAFSPDGRTCLTGAKDKLLILWDAAAGTQLRQFEGHTDQVLAAAFSPDGQTAVSGSADNSLILWDVNTGEPIRRFIKHKFWVTGVAYSPDGQTVISSSLDYTLILWDVNTGAVLREFTGGTDWVWSVAFSPDGERGLSGAEDGTLTLWNVSSGTVVRRFEGHGAQVTSAVFSPDGRFALSGSRDATLIAWDLATGETLLRYTGHHGAVGKVLFNPDGSTAYSASADTTIRQWQISRAPGDLLAWIADHRYIRKPTCVERERYRIEPLCPEIRPTPARPNEST